MGHQFKQWLLKSYFSNKIRAKTWKKLAALMKHHIGLRQALMMLRDRYAARKHPLQNVFSAVLDEINKGQPLDVAFYPWVPHEEIMLIRGGIQGDGLRTAFLDCVQLIQAKDRISKSIVSAVAYPMFLVLALVVLLLTVSLYLVPELALISNPSSWDGAAAILYYISMFIASPAGLIFGLAFITTIALSILSLPVWTGPLRVRFDNIPPWSIYRLTVGSVWLFTVAILLKANIQLDFILKDMLASKVLRPWLHERVQLIRDRYQVEANFGTLLLNLNMNFPDKELVEDLAVYAQLPDFSKDLYEIAKDWLDEGTERIAEKAQVINSALLVCIIAIICGIGIGVGSMQNQLSNMGGM